MISKISFTVLSLLGLLVVCKTQDFDMACKKQQEGKNWIGCAAVDFPETAMSVYLACMKEQSDKDMMSFFTMICKDKKERDKWVNCQKKMFDSGEATLDDDEKKSLADIEACIRAL